MDQKNLFAYRFTPELLLLSISFPVLYTFTFSSASLSLLVFPLVRFSAPVMRRPADDTDARPLFSIDNEEEEENAPVAKPSFTPFTHIRDTHPPPSLAHIRINRVLFSFFPRVLLLLFFASVVIALLPGGWRVALCAANFVAPPQYSAGGNVTIVGHRGCEWPYPENSLQALTYAAKEVGAVELDVGITTDGVVVLLHDEDLPRTTNGTGLVCMRDMQYIKSLQLKMPKQDARGRLRQAKFCEKATATGTVPCTYRVATLADVLDDLPDDTVYMIDIKECYAPGITVDAALCSNCTRLMTSVRQVLSDNFVNRSQVIFTSTQSVSLDVFRKGIPGARYMIGLNGAYVHYKRSTLQGMLDMWKWDGATMYIGLAAVRPDLVDVVRKGSSPQGLFGWTVRSDLQYRLARCAGIDNLIVADPQRIQKLLSFDVGSLLGDET